MSRSQIAYIVGSSALVLYGIGHTLGYVTGKLDPENASFVAALKAMPAKMPGVSRTRLDLFEGYSWMTAAMLLAYGLLNLLLVRVAPQLVAGSRALAGLNAAVSLLLTGLAWRYFFLPPLSLSAIATVAFALAAFWAE